MKRLSLWEEFVLSRREVSEKVEPVGGVCAKQERSE